VTSTPSLNLSAYQAAHGGAAYFRWHDPGYLRIGGADRETYVQRQTTNDARTLAPDRALLTVLTSATARILDVWLLLVEPDDQIGVITLPGRGAITARYLHSRIFFMDKVTVTDASAQVAQVELIGPAAGDVLAQIGLAPAPTPGAVIEGDGLRGIGIGVNRWWWIGAPDRIADLLARFESAGAAALDAETYDVLRIEAGQPGPARELTEDYTPLEANLDAAISGSKGCYTGQEVIARQVTYDKVTRRLVGLRLAVPASPGAEVQIEGRTVGVITSAAESPRLGSVALAVLRRPHHAPGLAIRVGGTISGVTAALPFEEG
jgi:folate-binding protein YgfZ